jgi:transcriptional regulator GlxA family with amidase domain
MSHRVVVLALDAVLPLDLGIPLQVFGDRAAAPYELSLCAVRRGPVRTTSGFAIDAPRGIHALRGAQTVIVPGFAPHLQRTPPAALTALRQAYRRGCRIVSICTGAFALAQAGLLDGRTVTTHWRHAQDLASHYPVRVDPDVLYRDDGQILTSAGVATGIDLCLHLVRSDFGARVANEIARSLVAPPHRPGGQAQYTQITVPARGSDGLAATLHWALENLAKPLTLQDLSAHAHVSPRTLARRFAAQTGLTPMQWLASQRIAHAQHLLEITTLSVPEIARQVGLGTDTNLRLHFRRRLQTSPTDYRRTFSQQSEIRGVGHPGFEPGTSSS